LQHLLPLRGLDDFSDPDEGRWGAMSVDRGVGRHPKVPATGADQSRKFLSASDERIAGTLHHRSPVRAYGRSVDSGGPNNLVPASATAEEWSVARRGGTVPGTTSTGERFDILFVGDVAVDQYLTLTGDAVTVEEGPESRRLVLPFGAKVACEVTSTVPAGGNSANAAVACARLGLRTALVAYVGDDGLGRGAVAALRSEGVDASLVRLRVGHERTILVHHEQHECHWPHLRPAEVPSWLYLSSVGTDSHAYEDQIVDWLETEPEVSLAFEPGTLQIARGAEALSRMFRRSALVVCNREEAAALTGGHPGDDPVRLLDGMLALGPEQVVVTDGSAGAFGTDGRARYAVPVFPDDGPVVDRTGAGDAFAGTLVAAVATGLPLDRAMARAPVNSMRVVQQVGSQAGLLDDATVEALLAAAPDGYGVRELVPAL
jgi:ribokinase